MKRELLLHHNKLRRSVSALILLLISEIHNHTHTHTHTRTDLINALQVSPQLLPLLLHHHGDGREGVCPGDTPTHPHLGSKNVEHLQLIILYQAKVRPRGNLTGTTRMVVKLSTVNVYGYRL